jgi:hypothetical protein
MATICEWFGLKTTRTVFVDLTSKPAATVSGGLASNLLRRFHRFGLKTGGDGFYRFGLKTCCDGFWRFCLKTYYDGFLWFGLKTMATVFSSLASKLMVTVSPGLASKPVVGFMVEPQNQGGGGFSGLGLKTGSFCLVIWTSKSPRRFLSLDLKTKWASVCRLHHNQFHFHSA